MFISRQKVFTATPTVTSVVLSIKTIIVGILIFFFSIQANLSAQKSWKLTCPDFELCKFNIGSVSTYLRSETNMGIQQQPRTNIYKMLETFLTGFNFPWSFGVSFYRQNVLVIEPTGIHSPINSSLFLKVEETFEIVFIELSSERYEGKVVLKHICSFDTTWKWKLHNKSFRP